MPLPQELQGWYIPVSHARLLYRYLLSHKLDRVAMEGW